MNISLENKIAIVTGSSRGIGKAIALGLAHAGADVVVVSRKLRDLEIVAEEIKRMGRESMAVSAHVGKMEEIYSLVERVSEKFGRIDILVNNAGGAPILASALSVEEALWDKVINLNLKGLFFLSQTVAKVMKANGGGKIINISSIDGYKPHENLGVYAISKAGTVMATKVMAKEWAKYNIRVNGIAPGFVDTRLTESLFGVAPGMREEALRQIPLGRIGGPDEIAAAAIFLSSDQSSFVTGHVVVVDGGFLLA